MNLARVIGSVWATRKVDNAAGATLQLIQPLSAELTQLGHPLVACDTVGAGPGELVFYVTAYEAVIPFVTRAGGPGLGTLVPMDAAIVGIIEQLHRDDGHLPSPVSSVANPSSSSPGSIPDKGTASGPPPKKKRKKKPATRKPSKKKSAAGDNASVPGAGAKQGTSGRKRNAQSSRGAA